MNIICSNIFDIVFFYLPGSGMLYAVVTFGCVARARE